MTRQTVGDDPGGHLSPRPLPRGARVVGASMVGIGAILQPTHDPEAHWSEPNQITLVTESEDPASDGSADLELDATAVPAGPPAKPPLVGRRPPQV